MVAGGEGFSTLISNTGRLVTVEDSPTLLQALQVGWIGSPRGDVFKGGRCWLTAVLVQAANPRQDQLAAGLASLGFMAITMVAEGKSIPCGYFKITDMFKAGSEAYNKTREGKLAKGVFALALEIMLEVDALDHRADNLF